MKTLNPYLAFGGTCEEALNFYKDALDGEIGEFHRFEGAPMEVPEHYKQKVMHAEFRAEDIHFMASDGSPDDPPKIGDNISLNINLTDEAEQDRIFEKLSAGGKVSMPIQDTFWGARFGMLTDKYGIVWLLNVNKET